MAITMCGPNCTFEQKNSFRGCGDPQVSFEGAVLDTWERNGYDDSDFYALVWDAEAGTLRTIEYATTRGWTHHNGAHVDATEEVLAAARGSMIPRVVEMLRGRYTDEATAPSVGRTVRSTTRSGKNKGVEGVVRWYGEDSYARDYGLGKPMKVGVVVEGEKKLRYFAASNAEVLDPGVVPSDEVLLEEARRLVEKSPNPRSLVNLPLSGLGVYI
jgi:hypothetical protein